MAKKKKVKKIKRLTLNQNRKKIDNLSEQLAWFFDVNSLDKRLELMKEDFDDRNAEIEFDESYQSIIIRIYPKFFKNSLSFQRKILLHEFIHTITLIQEILSLNLLKGDLVTEKQVRNENEKATSKIENLLDNLLNGKSKYIVKAYKDYLI